MRLIRSFLLRAKKGFIFNMKTGTISEILRRQWHYPNFRGQGAATHDARFSGTVAIAQTKGDWRGLFKKRTVAEPTKAKNADSSGGAVVLDSELSAGWSFSDYAKQIWSWGTRKGKKRRRI